MFLPVFPYSPHWEDLDFLLGHGLLWSLSSPLLLLAVLVTLLFSNPLQLSIVVSFMLLPPRDLETGQISFLPNNTALC